MGPKAPRKKKSSTEPPKPLLGRRVVITRARSQASSFAEAVEALGGEALVFPTIEISDPQSYQSLDDAIRQIGTYDWIIFTSVNGVKSLLGRLRHFGKDYRVLDGLKIAVIGPETAKAVASASLHVDIVPGEFCAEAILEKLDPGEMAGKRILMPRAAVARNVLPATLEEWGAIVDVAAAYQTVPAQSNANWLRELFLEGKVDVITFTSSSTVTHFAALFEGERLGDLLARAAVACIGPITRATVESVGIPVDIVPREYTILGLTQAVVDYFNKQSEEA